MTNQVVSNNIDILKKIRLLNIEVNNLLYKCFSGSKDLFFVKKNGFIEDIEKLNVEISSLQEEIKLKEKEILAFDEQIKLVPDTDSSDKKEILELKKKICEKKISDNNKVCDLKNKELDDIQKAFDLFREKFKSYESDEETESSSKINELYKSISYLKDLLNNNVREKYDLICKSFDNTSYRYPIAILKEGFCENCNMQLPIQRKIDILEMKDFVMCELCGCFLIDVE